MLPAINARDLESFAAAIANQVDQTQLDPSEFPLWAAADDGDAIQLLAIDDVASPGTS